MQSPLNAYPSSEITVLDFNEDGYQDLATYLLRDSCLITLEGDGKGKFQEKFRLSIAKYLNASYRYINEIRDLNTGDFNEDNHQDIVAVGGDRVLILLGDGMGSFTTHSFHSTAAKAVILSDFNRDNHTDLAIIDDSSDKINVYLGTGKGTFNFDTYCGTANAPHDLVAADFNQDSWIDIAVSNRLSNGISVFLNNYITAVDSYNNTSIPQDIILNHNFPNPFNPETNIEFNLPNECNIRLIIYNINGQEIRTLANQYLIAGFHTLTWNGQSNNGIQVPSGVYFYRLIADNYVESKKMLLIR